MCISEEYKKVQTNDSECDSEVLRRIDLLESQVQEFDLQMTRLEEAVEREISIKQSTSGLDQLSERVRQVETFITQRFPQYKRLIESSAEDPDQGNDK